MRGYLVIAVLFLLAWGLVIPGCQKEQSAKTYGDVIATSPHFTVTARTAKICLTIETKTYGSDPGFAEVILPEVSVVQIRVSGGKTTTPIILIGSPNADVEVQVDFYKADSVGAGPTVTKKRTVKLNAEGVKTIFIPTQPDAKGCEINIL